MLQAAIASLHADDPQDWPQIAALYGELGRLTGSPVVELNRAAAIAEAGDTPGALALIESIELDDYHYLHATRAELLRRLNHTEEAGAAYERAPGARSLRRRATFSRTTSVGAEASRCVTMRNTDCP